MLNLSEPITFLFLLREKVEISLVNQFLINSKSVTEKNIFFFLSFNFFSPNKIISCIISQLH